MVRRIKLIRSDDSSAGKQSLSAFITMEGLHISWSVELQNSNIGIKAALQIDRYVICQISNAPDMITAFI